ncbi:O-antigen ligase family protein [Pantoea stewartii]|uniref:O-antigen ligase family protein n=1 Tax=Pantoea stewartii TaxID=66269 RepID=UPI0019803DF4|nr:O-antigen ligase family protein [Pantoea stewartii]
MTIKFRVPAIVLALSCISFSTALNASTLCRNALFLAFILSLIDLFRKRQGLKRDKFFIFSLSSILLASGMVFHAKFFPSTTNFSVDENYYFVALRILMASFIVYYLTQLKQSMTKNEINFSKLLVLIGFLYVSVQAVLIHHQHPDARLEIKTVATTVAYVYAVQVFAALYIASTYRNRFSFILTALITLSGFYVLLLTETRSVILTYPIIIFLYLIQAKLINLKTIFFMFVTVAAVAIVNYKPFYNAFERIVSTSGEIKDYKNNNGNTSLGARFSLWKAGIYAFKLNPLGQSADQRYIEIKSYIDEYEYKNPEALRAIDFHMHNDFIDSLSLRGIWGALLLAFFFSSLAFIFLKNNESHAGVILLLMPNAIYGLTDTLFIDLRCATVLMLGVPVYLLIKRQA